MMIPAGTTKVTVPVATLNDNFKEDDEFFKATLSLPGAPEAVVVGSPNMAFVTITDDDGKLGLFVFFWLHVPFSIHLTMPLICIAILSCTDSTCMLISVYRVCVHILD